MKKKKKKPVRRRDAGTGRMISRDEAKKKPKNTWVEERIKKRVKKG